MDKIEKERKFLLKRMPKKLIPIRKEVIIQCYLDGYRYRNTLDVETGDRSFERIQKKKMADGYNMELDVTKITQADYDAAYSKCERVIMKDRSTYEYEGKVFEVDMFYRMNLIMMEVEDVELKEEIKMPPEIEEVLLLEVTGNVKFDNHNLAIA